MSMLESFQKNGQWWLPDQEKKVPGILTFDPASGISVSLFQPLNVEFAKLHFSQSQVIHGIVDGSIKVSLLDCLEVIGSTRLAREIHSSSKIDARQCVIGTHLSSSTRFNNFQLVIHNYAQFICRTGFQPVAGHDAGFMWDRVEPIEFEVDGDRISLGIEAQAPFSFFDLSATIKESATISIITKRPTVDLDEIILGVSHSLKTMLEFSLGYPVPIIQFQAVATDACGQDENIEIFYSQSGHTTQKIGNPHHDMLFSFCKRSDEDVRSLVRTWINFYDDNRLAVDMLISSGVKGPGDKRPEPSFFFLIGSLEALQRNCGKLKLSMADGDFQELKNLVFNVLPKNKIGDWMRNRIGKMNEPSLPQRLGDVLDAMPKYISERIINEKVLIRNLVKARTLFAHQIDRMGKNNDVLYIWHLTEVLWAITVIYILGLLGFACEEIDGIMKNKITMLNALNWIEEVSSDRTTK